MYIAEISPARVRGRLVAITQFNIVLGILLGLSSNYIIGSMGLGAHEARWMFGIMTVPSVLFFFLLFLTPQSPRWLIANGKVEEAGVFCNGAARLERASMRTSAIFRLRWTWTIPPPRNHCSRPSMPGRSCWLLPLRHSTSCLASMR